MRGAADNENAAFDAGLRALQHYGGILVAVDTGPDDSSYRARFNANVSWGSPIDPNRNLSDGTPRDTSTLLIDLQTGPRLIIALHTNAPGFDAGISRCGSTRNGGSGEISIHVCNAQFRRAASHSGSWPFDDDDSLAVLPFRSGADRSTAFCART
ncbi:hypothetical protein QH494_27390 [Sphingomonas sp. AR_OL41]|uniref:hypothetical protein n=1 Tax=Sphingomonas sp. AR_OL41 TaxID=3042729 RepID=UPI0024801738|nr:hypothetical protein [Sphingomonas sp. AR_OL41]MDH7975920.1 hypothetical protein [Sphingomonas sp. AR_OL41]